VARLGLTVCGGVDEIWVNDDGELIVVDYKATSKDGKIESLDEEWHIGYKRQIEIYQWLLRKNGFKVSDTAYWVYANASKDEEAFDGKLIFEVTLVPHQGDDSWVEETLREIKACLDSPALPEAAADCDYCRYRETVGKKMLAFAKKRPASGAGTLGI
jgi:CRISPR/Cas system-associated exonuclease Cas4 (RecB family)